MKQSFLILAGCSLLVSATAFAGTQIRFHGSEHSTAQPLSLSEQVSRSEAPHVNNNQKISDPHGLFKVQKGTMAVRPAQVNRKATQTFTYTPTEEDFALFTVIDGNKDYNTFTYQDTRDNIYSSYQGQFISSGGGGKGNQDDWLIFPAVNIENNEKFWEVAFDICLCSSWGSNATFEVFAGDEPTAEAMTIPVIGRTDVSSEEFMRYSDIFAAPSNGQYYVGIHNVSSSYSYGFFLKELALSETDRNATGPSQVENLTLTASEGGALSAVVTFNLPATDIKGNLLDSSANLSARVFIASAPEGVVVSGKPGQEVSCTLATEQGWNDVHVNCTLGEGTSKDVIGRVFTGYDVPGPVSDFKVYTGEDPHDIIFEWQPPTYGQNGFYVDSAGTETNYYLVVGYDTFFGTYWQVYDFLGTGVTSAQLVVDAGIVNSIYKMGIVAETVAGQGEYFASGIVQAGDTESMPVIEDFWGGESHHLSYYISDDANLEYGAAAELYLVRPSSYGVENETGLAMIFSAYQECNAHVILPRFSTLGESQATATINVYTDNQSPESINFYATAFGVDPIMIGTTGSDKEGWQEIKYELPAELMGKEWVDIYAEVHFTGANQRAFIDRISFKRPVEHELGIMSVTGPASILMGENAVWQMIIRNIGVSTETAPTVTCKVIKGDKVIDESEAVLYSDDIIAPDGMVVYELYFLTNSDATGELTISAEFDFDDENKDNNKASWVLDVTTGNKVFVSDLTGSREEDGSIKLEWTEPVLASSGSFEYDEAFAITDKIGPFINIDLDEQERSSFSLWSFPNMGVPAAFQVWDIDEIHACLSAAGFSPDYEAADGQRVLVAICPYDYGVEADDWLISPELEPGSAFSFMMCPMSSYYGDEAVEVLTSAGSTDPNQFTVLADASMSPQYGDPREWQSYSYVLPEGHNRFAIRYHGIGLGIMVDDVVMNAVNGEHFISGYTIRRNGTVIEESAAAGVPFIDTADVEAGTTYNVQPIITEIDGTTWKGEISNTATILAAGVAEISDNVRIIQLDGGISIIGAAGKHVSVSAIDGICRWNGEASENCFISLNAGVYIVQVDTITLKLIVR
ncbi:MAG: choice-of-anchor J domain-containing protein [Muribaculaceae bacterium]